MTDYTHTQTDRLTKIERHIDRQIEIDAQCCLI